MPRCVFMCIVMVVSPYICLFTYYAIAVHAYKGIDISVYVLAIMDMDALFPSLIMLNKLTIHIVEMKDDVAEHSVT